MLQKCDVEGDFFAWPRNLRWLKWSQNFKLLELPSTMHLPNLVVLDLNSNECLTQLWPTKLGEQVPCPQLRILLLNNCRRLRELPRDIGSLSRLQTLDLESCKTMKTLPDSIGNLKELEHLSLYGCIYLEGLPESIARLHNLRVISLEACKKLRELPESFGSLQRLVAFDATSSGLSKLPKTFSRLINLEEIILENYTSLHELPTTMKHFVKLTTFNARGTICHYLPRDFEHLHNLNVLRLHNIEEGSILMPQDSVLYLCDTLEVLELINCRGHPLNIHEFKRLRTLTLCNSSLEGFLGDDQHHGCSVPITPNYDNNYASPSKILNAIIEIPNLEYLELRNCNYIKKLSSTIPGLLNLISLTIHECPLHSRG